MALTPEDLQALSGLMDTRIQAALGAQAEAAQAEPQDRTSVAGKPDVDPEAGPSYYVHLANGDVITSKDSASTHVDVDGKPVLVIGRYTVGE